MRLDKNVMPTKNRFGTVAVEEMERLRNVRNIIRKGRVAAVDKEKVRFESGEVMDLPERTLIVDCARNSTKFPQDKMVFDGDRINLQFILVPPPGESSLSNSLYNIHFACSRIKHDNNSWNGTQVS